MTDHILLAKIGQTIWGAAWQGPMAAALKQSQDTLTDWTSARTLVPADVWKALREITRLHYLKLADLDPQIVEAYDIAVARTSAKR